MRKLINLSYAALVAVLALSLDACTNEYEYDAAVAEGQQVYFSSSMSSKVDLSSTETYFPVTVMRVKTDEAISVPLTLTDESGLFSIPSSANFAAGSSETTFNVTYDPEKFTYDEYKDVTITIANADYTTPYGDSVYSFSAGVPSPWTSLGIGQFIDNYFYGDAIEVEIQQNDLDKSQFRVVNPYNYISEYYGYYGYTIDTSARSEYFEFTVMQAGQELAGVTLSQSDLVYYSAVCTGIDVGWTGGCVYLYHPAAFSSRQQESYWTHNYVEAYQDNGLPGAVSIAPLFITKEGYGSDQSTTDDVIQIVFPGYEMKDYSATVSYSGAFIDTSDNTYAMGNIKIGADVEEAQVAVVEGDNVESALNDVLNGTVDITTITESGEVRIECPYTGTCTMIAVTYADGEAQDYGYATFNFNAGGSDWKSVGTGLYTDHIFTAFLTDGDGNAVSPCTYEVEVQESKTTPGLYRILHPYAPGTYYYEGDLGYDESGDYNIIINATDPDHVYIEPQSMGFPTDYGDLMIATVGGMYVYLGYDPSEVASRGYMHGTLENGVITFPAQELSYTFASYASQGYYWYISESATSVLTLPSAVTAKAKARANAAKKNVAAKTVKYKSSKDRMKKIDGKARFMTSKAFGIPLTVNLE